MAKSHTAGWASDDAPTPAQLAELFRQIDAGRVTKQKLQVFLRNSTPTKDYELARDILDHDFIGPKEVANARGVSYDPEQILRLTDTLPTKEQLFWLKNNSYALVAGSPTDMSLLNVRSANPSLFYYKTKGWYADQPFSVNDKVYCRWLAIRKTEVPNSRNKKWDAQKKLLSKDEEVPNATEMSWFITTYYEIRGVRLFENVYVRTSSVASDDNRVGVGYFDGCGLGIFRYWDDVCYSYLGVSASRKF